MPSTNPKNTSTSSGSFTATFATTLTTREHVSARPPTTSLPSLGLVQVDGEVTATTLGRGSKLAYREFVAPTVSSPSGALSPEEFLAARARARGGRSLSEARKVVGEHLYRKDGSPIARYRLLRGLSQQDLAEALGTTQSHVSRMESGADLLLDTVKRLAVVLNVRAAQLASELLESNHDR